MRRVPDGIRTCAERRLGACLCRLGYGNLANCSPTTVDLRGRYHLERPERKGEEWDAGHGEECGGTVSFGLTNP